MSVVLLARHANASFGLGSYDQLSELGRDQARHLGEVLGERAVPVQRIVCGTLQRQRETAEILSSVLGGRPITEDARWNEYDHMPLIVRVKPSYRRHWVMIADLARTGNPNRRLQEIIDRALLAWVQASEPPLLDEDGEPADPPTVVDPRTGDLLHRPPGGVHELDVPDGEGDDTESFAEYSARVQDALSDISLQSGTSLVVSSAGSISAAVAPLLGMPALAWPGMQRVMVNTSLTKVVRGQRGMTAISWNEHGHLEGAPGLRVTYR